MKHRITITLSTETEKQLDDWRAIQRPIMTRTEAINYLVIHAITEEMSK